MKAIVLQKFGNNRFSFGWRDLPPVIRSGGDLSEQKRQSKEAQLVLSAGDKVICAGSIYALLNPHGVKPRLLAPSEVIQVKESSKRSLDLICEFQRARKQSRKRDKSYASEHRPTAFGRNARRCTLESAYVGARWAGAPDRAIMFTGTLPGNLPRSMGIIARWSGYICNRLFQLIRRSEKKVLWQYVWEFQSRGALHLHLLVYSQHDGHAMDFAGPLQEAWWKILQDINSREGYHVFTASSGDCCRLRDRWQAKTVSCDKGTVGAYLAKYLSKPKGKGGKGTGFGKASRLFYPARWWGRCRELKQLCDAERIDVRLVGLTEGQLVHLLAYVSEWVKSFSPVHCHSQSYEVAFTYNGRRIVVGSGFDCSSFFSEDAYQQVCREVWGLLRYCVDACSNAVMQYRYGEDYKMCQTGD